MKKLLVVCAFSFITVVGAIAQKSGYSITGNFRIGGTGGWDYIAVHKNKLYVSHSTQVHILDKFTGDSLGVILNTNGVHGIAFVDALNKGFTSNGRLNNVTVFDLLTNEVLAHIPTGQNPDAIFYDDFSKKVITCNGGRNSLSIIDPKTGKVTDTVTLSGKPETALSNGAGKVYVNIEDKSSISEVDIRNARVTRTWSISPGESPSGLAIDRKTNRLFAGCENKMLIVVNAENGKVVTSLPIGDGCDGTAFDPELRYVFSSNGDGTLTVIREFSKSKFEVLENLITKQGARTLALDLHTHSVYLPTANFEAGNNGQRPPIMPGTFQVLVLNKK